MKAVCVILAGGKSSRMGRDKAELPLSGETFLSRLVRIYSPDFPVYVSVGVSGKFPCDGTKELVDVHPGMGPLAGLEAAFLRTDADAVFLTATDLPFGTLELARKLFSQLGDADACVIRRADGQPEPAFGIYRRTCLSAVQELLAENRRAFRGLFDKVSVRWSEEAELEGFSLEQLLQNVNTPEEYEKVLTKSTAEASNVTEEES